MSQARFSFLLDGLEDLSYPSYQAEKAIRSYSPGDRPNAFSFLKGIYLEGHAPGTYRDLVISLEADFPGFSFPDVHLARLGVAEKAIVDSFSYGLDEKALLELTEPREVHLRLRLIAPGGEIAHHDAKIKALPVGLALTKEADPVLLASYVTSEDSEVGKAFGKALGLAKKKGVRLDGYLDRDPNAVLAAAETIYRSLLEEKIETVAMPTGRGRIYESVALPGTTLLNKKGTSLEIALVYASLLEKANLHPLILLYEDKAAVGLYLDEELGSSPLNRNGASLLVMASRGYDRLLLIDPSSGLPPEEARNKAYQDLDVGKRFLLAIDVNAARKEHILPLPTPDEKGNIVFPSFEREGPDGLRGVDEGSRRYIDSEDRGDKNRYDHWLDRLLDLNLKNRLINLRPNRSLPQLLVPDAEKFLDLLKENRKLVLSPYESYVSNSKRGDGLLDFPLSYFAKIAEENYERGIVPFLLSGEEANDDVIKALSRKSNTALEESGSNPLFLTIGLLRYFDNDRAASRGKGAMYAPILLLPVKIPLRKSGAHFHFEYDYDDITVNTTLFEYLDQAFGIDLSPLEGTIRRKDGQVDLRLIYNYIRGKIAAKKGFALIENASGIGLFSFAHFVMWDDLRRRKDDLLKNPHIASLVSGEISFREPEGLLGKEELDSSKEPLHPLPLPADSSQIKAIDDALKGASFVMDGPPGTGKSQTIANMIVAFLTEGKKVLFVAEKEVALDVVKKRLDQIGLGRFALFLSSSRTAKGEVLSSLGELIGLGALKSDISFEEKSTAFKKKGDELNRIVDSIHGKGQFLFSIEKGIDLYLETLAGRTKFDFPLDEARRLDLATYRTSVDSIKELAYADEKANGAGASPFTPFTGREYSPIVRDALLEELRPLVDLDQELYLAEHNAFSCYPSLPKTRQNALLFKEIVDLDASSGGLFASYYLDPDSRLKDEETRRTIATMAKKEAARKKILALFKESAFNLPAEALEQRERELRGGFFARHRAKKDLQALLEEHLLVKRKLTTAELNTFLAAYRDYHASGQGNPILEFEGDNLSARFEATLEARAKVESLIASSRDPKKARKEIATANPGFGSEAARRLSRLLDDHLGIEGRLENKHAFDLRRYEDANDYYKKERGKIGDCLSRPGEMAAYFAYLEAKEKCRALSASLVELFEKGKCPAKRLLATYQNALALRIVSEEANRNGLSGLSHERIDRLLASYAQSLKEYQAASIAECAAVITSKYPSPQSGNAASSDLYRLRKLIANGGRGVSLRSLLHEFGGLISTLCPCYLMSPLSVAQFLRKEDHFDVAIFDEASQIPTSEAIGAISHAGSIVVAGDQMQMPPTDFFKSTVTGVEEGEDSFLSIDEDLESLLDDVIVMGYPRNRLNFHYRSRNEKLIAFSNERFYGNSLFTFPSPSDRGTGVSFVKVHGDYLVGRGINRPEAMALVEEVKRRLSDENERKRSIGIVTFNEAQQNLILDLLERKAPEAFAYVEGREPIFVKNLENVQGDERDVILFSTTYGPSKSGELSINFGPLSRAKGERRLNVAISRAREEMLVYSSFEPEEIRAERAKNAGARFLRDFLFYARDGEKALYKVAGSLSYEERGKVASCLASDLRKLGYEVDLDVGTSLFRIDLAIKGNDGGYALGILLDGASYLSAPTSQDRNLVQPSILSSLGWKYIRFYCLEYFDRPDEVIREIVNVLNGGDALDLDSGKPDLPSFQKEEMNLAPNAVPYRLYREDAPSNDEAARIDRLVRGIVFTEAPVAHSLLERRIKETLGLKALTSKYRSLIGMSLEGLAPVRENYPNEQAFYYPPGFDVRSYRYYRPDLLTAGRSVEEVGFVELSNLYRDILLTEGRLVKEDLVKTALLRLGSPAFRKKGNDHLLLAIKCALNEHRGIKIDDSGYLTLDDVY